jgi:hypothetical protein
MSASRSNGSCFHVVSALLRGLRVLPQRFRQHAVKFYPCCFRCFSDRLLEYLNLDADNDIKEADTRSKYALHILKGAHVDRKA